MKDPIDSIEAVDVTARDLPAGGFSSWLERIRSAQVEGRGVDVPCGECNACCRSSYFIHITPDEAETLARIPDDLLFPAPGLPEGNRLLGYDENGHCPMLIDDRCSIYEHRPRTCRSYDCRVFPAAGIIAAEDDKAPIARQTPRWRFGYPTEQDRDSHAAVRAAVRFLQEHEDCFPDGIPNDSTRLAVLAIKVYDVFLAYQQGAEPMPPAVDVAKAVITAAEQFDV